MRASDLPSIKDDRRTAADRIRPAGQTNAFVAENRYRNAFHRYQCLCFRDRASNVRLRPGFNHRANVVVTFEGNV